LCFDEVTFRAPKAHFIFWEVALFDVLAREDKDTAMAFVVFNFLEECFDIFFLSFDDLNDVSVRM
jgi:hypothetical protein